MNREGKGSGIRKPVKDYCVLDLETTGVFISSADIIEISVIKVRDNQVVEEFSTLVNPHCHIPAAATAVNHITDDMVKDAPELKQVLEAFVDFVGDDVIVGYNNAGFDMNLIYDALMDCQGSVFKNDYLDILHMSRRCLPELENHKLETLSKHYALDTIGEHRALKDCYLTKECYDRLYQEFGISAFPQSSTRGGNHSVRYSAETLYLQELQMLLEKIIADGEVTLVEFMELKEWMENHRDLQGNYPFDRVFNALDRVLEDRRIDPDELEELQILFSDFVDPVKNRGCHEMICSFWGKHICVTGDFDYGPRSSVCELIEEVGGIVDKSVKKATQYVVVGAKGSENWKTGNYGGKIQKAMEMIDKGADIKIIEENDFITSAKQIIASGINSGESLSEECGCDKVDWRISVREILEDLIAEYELPKGSIYLSDNYGQKGKNEGKLISHTVCIWEPDYPQLPNEKPGPNKVVITISPSTVISRPNDLDLNVRETQEGDLHKYLPEDAELLPRTKSDLDTGMVRIRIKNDSVNLAEYIKQNTIYCIQGYESKATRFGCCSSFEKCSDAKKCVHENKLYSKACMYRDHLDQGRIFYGKNRNVD